MRLTCFNSDNSVAEQPTCKRVQQPRRVATVPLSAIAILSLVALAVLIGLLVWNARRESHGRTSNELLVYCAVAVQPAVREIAANYESQRATSINLQTGPSGGLDTQIRLSKKGDLYIPAAQSPYLDRMEQDGLVRKVLPLAEFRLVLAFPEGADTAGLTLDDLLVGKFAYALANEEAAVGLATRETLEPHGVWPQIKADAKAVLPTVTNVAQAVQRHVAVDCGFIWDTTARQFGLKMIDLPELAKGRAAVAVGVLKLSGDPAAAEAFAEYLAAPETGQPVFRRLGYTLPAAD